jgi:hypothetical protein
VVIDIPAVGNHILKGNLDTALFALINQAGLLEQFYGIRPG